jgi:hypothetical protein
VETGDVGEPRVRAPFSARAGGAAIGFCGQVLTNAVVYGAVLSQGGGMNADLEPGGRFGILLFLTYGASTAQLLLVGVLLVFVTRKRSRPFTSGVWLGWTVGLLAAVLWCCAPSVLAG